MRTNHRPGISSLIKNPLASMAAILTLTCAATPFLAASGPLSWRSSSPPLIDRELFFGDPEISQERLSPDGNLVAFLKPYNGILNIWVKHTAEPIDDAKRVTAARRPIDFYDWSADSKYILYAQDQGGNEQFSIYATAVADGSLDAGEMPAGHQLTPSGARAIVVRIPYTHPNSVYVGLNDRDAAWTDLYRIDISTGERKLLMKNTDRIVSWVFDLNDDLRLVTQSGEDGSTEISRVSGFKLQPIYSCALLEECRVLGFDPDGRHVFMASNKGKDVNLVRLTRIDATSGDEQVVDSDPRGMVDLRDVILSNEDGHLIGTYYVDDRPRYIWRDPAFKRDFQWLQNKLRRTEIRVLSRTHNDQRWLVRAWSDVEPGEYYLFDRATKQLKFQYRILEGLPRDSLVPMTPVRYRSTDGLEIPAYLELPKGEQRSNLPLIVMVHGGPWDRFDWGFEDWAEFLANRGYAVLLPNFRGSAFYGKKYRDAANRQWGDKMQDDITSGVRYLVARHVADPHRVAIVGWSYGGYSALAGISFTPDLYAAAISFFGPSNLETLLSSQPAHWFSDRLMFRQRVGDPTTPEGRAQLERQSPINAVERIHTPVLLVNGANDPRVGLEQSNPLVIALRDRGVPVKYLVASDEGHGFEEALDEIATSAAAEEFLAKYLHSRCQAPGPPDVAKRLKALTVDIYSLHR